MHPRSCAAQSATLAMCPLTGARQRSSWRGSWARGAFQAQLLARIEAWAVACMEACCP